MPGGSLASREAWAGNPTGRGSCSRWTNHVSSSAGGTYGTEPWQLRWQINEVSRDLTEMKMSRFSYLKSVQRVDQAQQSTCCEETIQVHIFRVQLGAILQAITEVVKLGLGQRWGRTQDPLVPGGREVGLQSHINHHATQTEDYGHLDQALSEVLFKILHGVWGVSRHAKVQATKLPTPEALFLLPCPWEKWKLPSQLWRGGTQFSPIAQLNSCSACRCRRSTHVDLLWNPVVIQSAVCEFSCWKRFFLWMKRAALGQDWIWHCLCLLTCRRMTVEGSGSVREKIRKTLLIITTLFHAKGLLSLLPPAYPAVLLKPLDVINHYLPRKTLFLCPSYYKLTFYTT